MLRVVQLNKLYPTDFDRFSFDIDEENSFHICTDPLVQDFFIAATGVENGILQEKNEKKSRHKLAHSWSSRVAAHFASV